MDRADGKTSGTPHEQPSKLAWLLGLSMACLLCGACGSSARGPLLVDVIVGAELNGNRPLAVDFIAIYDLALLNEVQRIPARRWFRQKHRLDMFYKPRRDYELWSFEWVPGQRVGHLERPLKKQPRAIFVFADYAGQGTFRAKIENTRRFDLWLKDKDFGVYPFDGLPFE